MLGKLTTANVIEYRRFCTNAVTLIQNFWYKGSLHTNNFCTISEANECLTTLSLKVFTQLLRLRRYERK